MKRRRIILLIFAMFVLYHSCSDHLNDPNASEREIRLNGKKMINHLIDTDYPCIVNIMFQVLNMQNKGVPGLSTNDFQLKEDDDYISPSESGMYIMNRQSAEYVLRTVIMIDNSASIGDALSDLKKAANEYVDQITDYQQIAIFKFSDMPILLQYYTNEVNLLKAAIDEIDIGYPTTNLYGSAIEGLQLWNDVYQIDEIQQGILVLLTDGDDTQGSSTLKKLLEVRGEKMTYTIGIGNDIDSTILKKIGNAGYYHADDYLGLNEKFIEIQNDIINYANSFYWLVYFSPKRGNHQHLLNLYYENNPYTEKKDSYVSGNFNSAGFYSVNPGIYIQSKMSDPDGIDSLLIEQNAVRILEVDSYYTQHKPEYQWVSGNETILSVNVNFLDSSIAQVTALGTRGQTTKLTVQDYQNSLIKTIDVFIE